MSFNSSWSLYYHHPEDKNYDLNSYSMIVEMNNEKDFWSVHKLLREIATSFSTGMFFLMRDNIPPRYDDEPICHGSFYSFPVAFENAYEVWELLSALLVEEKLTEDTKIMKQTIGITLSPKKSNMIVKIWCRTKYDMPSEFPFNKKYFYFETLHAPFFREKSRYVK